MRLHRARNEIIQFDKPIKPQFGDYYGQIRALPNKIIGGNNVYFSRTRSSSAPWLNILGEYEHRFEAILFNSNFGVEFSFKYFVVYFNLTFRDYFLHAFFWDSFIRLHFFSILRRLN